VGGVQLKTLVWGKRHFAIFFIKSSYFLLDKKNERLIYMERSIYNLHTSHHILS
jgi:hypothetical protein